MNLAVLDIDGTLTDTNRIDSECYDAAVAAFLKLAHIESDWSRYPNVTDAGIFDNLCREHLGRPPKAEEVQRVQVSLLTRLQHAFQTQQRLFAPVPGAVEFLRELLDRKWAVVLATGAWECSARFKLTAAGISDVSLVSSDSALQRGDIVGRAVAVARAVFGQDKFDRVVCVGDALWDLSTARTLNFPFVGLGTGLKAQVLREHGATHLLPDFVDLGKAFDALENASVPDTARETVSGRGHR